MNKNDQNSVMLNVQHFTQKFYHSSGIISILVFKLLFRITWNKEAAHCFEYSNKTFSPHESLTKYFFIYNRIKSGSNMATF